MKKTVLALLVFACLTAWSEDLTAKDGTVYRNVTIVSASPKHMIIVHDGGGCQIEFKDLVPDSLTSEQRKAVEKELRYYAERTARIETARAEREAFETAQRKKGLLEFEGGWVTPLEREEILLTREEHKLELERKRVLLALEKAALEKEQLQTEKARYLLEGETRGITAIRYGYYTPYRGDCIPSLPRRHHGYHSTRNNTLIYKSKNNPYITFEGVADYNRGPFKR